ncbi:MAG: polysaccharide deacetylase family protein [bacterium]|nr:polysaccharide deacetylase family protein [bacterium]
MKFRIYPTLITLIDILGLNALYRHLNRDKGIILWYHGICRDDFDYLEGFGARHLSVSIFRKQVMHLKRAGYRFITMSEMCDRLERGESLGRCVTLTFDDGFRNVIEKAYPLMRELGLKGCFYLVTDQMKSGDILWTDRVDVAVLDCDESSLSFRFRGEELTYPLATRRQKVQTVIDIKGRLKSLPDQERQEHMEQFAAVDPAKAPPEFLFADWDEIRALDPRILEPGSHTRRHPSCARLTGDEQYADELGESKRVIEAETGQAVRHFCYPSGSYNDETVRQVKRFGYDSAVTTDFGFVKGGDDPLLLPRISFSENFRLFKAYISGSHYLASRITGLLRLRRPGR